jgi:hypothetical protein
MKHSLSYPYDYWSVLQYIRLPSQLVKPIRSGKMEPDLKVFRLVPPMQAHALQTAVCICLAQAHMDLLRRSQWFIDPGSLQRLSQVNLRLALWSRTCTPINIAVDGPLGRLNVKYMLRDVALVGRVQFRPDVLR